MRHLHFIEIIRDWNRHCNESIFVSVKANDQHERVRTRKVVVRFLLINQYWWYCVDIEMLLSNFTGRCVEESVWLEVFSNRMVCVPQNTILLSDKRKEYSIVRFQHIDAFDPSHLLYGRIRHSSSEWKQFVFGTITIVNVLLMSLYTGGETRVNLKFHWFDLRFLTTNAHSPVHNIDFETRW